MAVTRRRRHQRHCPSCRRDLADLAGFDYGYPLMPEDGSRWFCLDCGEDLEEEARP